MLWMFRLLRKENMTVTKKALAFVVISALLCCTAARASDWPHWRGPFFNGSTDETNLPSRFSQTENVAWVSPLPGHSSATPVICRQRVFVSSTVRESADLLALCFDAKTGKERWRKKLGASERKVPRNNMATPSPVTDGKGVYFLYGSGELAGLDYEGNILWSCNIEEKYGNIALKYGYASSPLLYGGKLYILVQRRHTPWHAPFSDKPLESFLLAVDPKTGRDLWKHERKTDAQDESLDSYASPIVFQSNGRTEILIIGGDYVTSHDPQKGTEFWRYEYARVKSTRWRLIASTVTGAGFVFGVEPRGNTNLFALRSGGRGQLSEDHVAWKFDGPLPDVCTPLYYKGNLYVLDGMKHGKAVTCLDAKTGKQKWQGKLGGRGPWRASLTAGDDKLYCINESGEVVVLAADNEQFKVICRTDLEDRPIQASIAIAGRHLFIRTANKLFCIGD
jgi:outer membrane protein assembly factor BamB